MPRLSVEDQGAIAQEQRQRNQANANALRLSPEDQQAISQSPTNSDLYRLARRVEVVHPPFWKIDPDLALALVGSGMPRTDVLKVSQGLTRYQAFSGLGGRNAPPTVRTAGVGGGGILGPIGRFLGFGGSSEQDRQEANARWNALTPQQRAIFPDVHSAEDVANVIAEAKQTYGFGEATVNIPDDIAKLAERYSSGETLHRDEMEKIAAYAKLFPPDEFKWHGVGDSFMARFVGEFGSGLNTFVQTTTDTVWSPITGTVSYLGQQASLRDRQARNAQAKAISWTDAVHLAAHPEMGPGSSLGVAVADAFGIDKRDPEYEKFVAYNALAAQFIVSPDILLAHAMRGVKLADEVITGYKDLRNAEKAAVEAGDFTKALDYKLMQEDLVSRMSRSFITRETYKFYARTVNETIYSKKGTEVATDILKLVNEGKGPAELQRYFASLTPQTAKALTAARGGTAYDVQEILYSWSRGEGATGFAEIKAELNTVTDKLSRMGYHNSGVDEVNQLLVRKHVLQARLDAQFGARVETVDSLPKSSTVGRILNEAPRNAAERRISAALNAHWKIPVVGVSRGPEYEAALNNLHRIEDDLAAAARNGDDALVASLRQGRDVALRRLDDAARRGVRKDLTPQITRLEEEKNLELGKLDNPNYRLSETAKAGIFDRVEKIDKELAPLYVEDGQRSFITTRQLSPTVGKLWDSVYDRRVWVHTSPTENVPPDALAHNLKQFESFMKAAGVSPTRRNEVLNLFTVAKNDSDYFKAMTRMGDAVGDAPLVQQGKRYLAALPSDEITRFFDSIASMRNYGLVPRDVELAGGGVMRVEDGTLPALDAISGGTISIPSGHSEMISFLSLPDINSMLEATSYARYLGRRLAASSTSGKILVRGAEGALAAYKWGTQFWKDAIILSRSFLGAFQARVIGEENVRMWAYDRAGGDIIQTPPRWMGMIQHKDDVFPWLEGDMLGMVRSDIERSYIGPQFKLRIQTHEPGFYEGLSGRLGQLHTEPLMRELASAGPEEAKKWLMSGGGWETRQVMDANVTRSFEEVGRGVLPERLATTAEQQARQAFDKAYSEAVSGISSRKRFVERLGPEQDYNAVRNWVRDATGGRAPGGWDTWAEGHISEAPDEVRAAFDRRFGGHAAMEQDRIYGDIFDAEHGRPELPTPLGEASATAPLPTGDKWDWYIDRKWKELQYLTKEHPRLLEAISTGDFKAYQSDLLTAEHARLETKLENLTNDYWDHGRELSVSREIKDTRTQLAEIDQAIKNPVEAVKVDDPLFADEIRKMVDAGEFVPPEAINGFWEHPKAPKAQRAVRSWLYEHLIQPPDRVLARQPLFRQIYGTELSRLKSLGWAEDAAKDQAAVRAARRTSDLLYDLGSRTSAQRFFRYMLPFAPAWQELLETYLWRIPKEYYPGIGHLYLYRNAKLVGDMFKEMGIDPNAATNLPFVGSLFSLAGAGGDTKATFYPSSANFITSGGGLISGPPLGPLPGVAIAALAKYTKNGLIDTIANAMLPFGLDVQLGPSTFNRAWEAAWGKSSPLELQSSAAQEIDFHFQTQTALNQVWMEWGRKNQPNPLDFAPVDPATGKPTIGLMTQSDRYRLQQATKAFMVDLERRAKNRSRFWSAMRAVIGGSWLTSIQVTTDTRQEYQKMNAEIRRLAGIADGVVDFTEADKTKLAAAYDTPEGQQLQADFARRFPGSEMYTTPNSIRGLLVDNLQGQDNTKYAAYLNGSRQLLTDDERITLTMYFNSRNVHDANVQAIIQHFGGTGTPQQKAIRIAQNYGLFNADMNVERNAWSNYTEFLNADGQALFQDMVSRNPKNQSQNTIDQERLLRLSGDLNEALPLLEENGFKPEGWSDLKRVIADHLREDNVKYGESKDPVLKALYSYFDNVLDPYYGKADKLFRKAENTARSQQGPIYDDLRHLADRQKSITGFPTAEEFGYASKSPEAQRRALQRWATRPVEWLTDFQRSKLGYQDAPAAGAFVELVGKTDDQVKQIGLTEGYTSHAYENAKANRIAYLTQQAQKMGVGALWATVQRPPYLRLLTARGVEPPAGFRPLAQDAEGIWGQLSAAGLSPRGTSARAIQLQQWLIGRIKAARRNDTLLNRWFGDMELALAPSGKAKLAKEDLYVALFFDNWNGAPAELFENGTRPAHLPAPGGGGGGGAPATITGLGGG